MERIIYSDTLNQTELLRTLAKRGINTFGLRVMSSYELALFILSKLGKSEKRRYLSNQEQDFIYYSLLKPNSFNDASNIRSAINSFRDTGNGNSYDELDSYLDKTFVKKLNTIKEAFTKYTQYKKDNNLYDLYDLLYELKANPVKIDKLEVFYYKDLPYSPVAVSTFSAFFDLKEEEFASAFKVESNNIEAVKCYGTNNEFAYFVNKMNGERLKLDQCLLVLTDTSVFSDLTNILERFDIPYTSSIGVPFGQTNVGKLVNQLKRMKARDYGLEAYKSLFSSPFFNRDNYAHDLVNNYDYDSFIQYAGWLRQGFESEVNPIDEKLYASDKRNAQRTHDICTALTKLINDVNKNQTVYSFVEKNVVVDDYHYEALQALKKYSDYCATYGVSFDAIVDNLLRSSIAQHISSSGKLYITSASKAFSCLREHVFVMGLDSNYPGSPTENYLIYDIEYENMGAKEYTSNLIVKKKEQLMNLLISCSPNCYLSYSFFNILENKLVNPSSIVFGITNGSEPAFSYEQDLLSKNVNVVAGFNNGKTSKSSVDHDPYTYDSIALKNKIYSPSEFNKYFDEKKKPQFILNYLFDIRISEEDDPHSVISARDLGTIFHSVATSFDNSKGTIVEQDFVNQGLKVFDDFMAIKPPIIQEAASKIRDAFEIGLHNFFKQDPGYECYKQEYKIPDCDVYGIHFGGRFDRLEVVNKGKPNEKYILVDYKTGYKNDHIANDVLSCMQGLIYAEMIEQKFGITVEKCVFRYPFINDESEIFFNKENREELKKYFEAFAADIEAGTLTCTDLSSPYLEQYYVLFSLMKELAK